MNGSSALRHACIQGVSLVAILFASSLLAQRLTGGAHCRASAA